jgi:phosphatidylglycerophosphatase C
MRSLRASGRRVVVATATERRLAAAFLAGIGAEHDLLIASELRWDGVDGAFALHRRGDAKRDALLAAGVDLGAATFFTDSFDDHATAALAGELVLVHPSDRALRSYGASGLAFTVHPPR